eukprot:1672408-Pyramimonas_sp.AAC.1
MLVGLLLVRVLLCFRRRHLYTTTVPGQGHPGPQAGVQTLLASARLAHAPCQGQDDPGLGM